MDAIDDVKVIRFDDVHAADFARLNYEWIEKNFVVEDHDREMLDDPRGYIIEKGGEVFFALCGGTVAGTVAMLKFPDGSFELAKMAVSPEFRGRGIANHLMTACIEFAKEAGSPKVFLESSRKLSPALALYRKFGFEETELDKNTPYSRCDVRMELAIKPVDV
jgi:ribosomal protein S18 acetylase RimI-like enzyme